MSIKKRKKVVAKVHPFTQRARERSKKMLKDPVFKVILEEYKKRNRGPVSVSKKLKENNITMHPVDVELILTKIRYWEKKKWLD